MKRHVSKILMIVSLSAGCEENFNPVAPYDPKIVVYSILQPDKDTQMVRVYTSYYPPNNDPLQNPDENPIKDAQVTLVEGTNSFLLRDTTIQRDDKTRYQSDIFAYYISPVTLNRGATYTLNVTSLTTGSISSKATVPDTASLVLSDKDLLHVINPWLSTQPISLQVTLAPQAKAYLLRLFIFFTSNRVGGNEEYRVEVPLNITKKCFGGSVFFNNTFTRMTQKFARSGSSREIVTFPARSYQITSYMQSYNWDARFRRAVFYLTQYDESLFNYYSLVNEYKDKHYVRADEPDYTNIQGGVGVFGSMAVDSLVVPLPEFMLWPYRWDEGVFNCPRQ